LGHPGEASVPQGLEGLAWDGTPGLFLFFTAEKVVLVDSLSRRLVAPCDGPMLVSFWAISDKIRIVEHV
jgi:hypothetical protein